MTREEYNLYRRIKSNVKTFGMPTYGCMYTIATDASVDFKTKLHNLYCEWDLHPASVRVDKHYFDDKERIIYIKGRTMEDDEGNKHDWSEYYTKEELKRFDEKLHQ